MVKCLSLKHSGVITITLLITQIILEFLSGFTIGLFFLVKKAIFPHINCDDCERQLEKSEFIAIIGKVPSTGLSMPMGRADAIFEKMGKIYCEQCFKKRYESKS
jgi:hypothetical protein